eukprot:m.94714 g.94714  ORF g.94714 m.94714 type:complete len:142 (-) comp13457_c0_seq6:318-743(-)
MAQMSLTNDYLLPRFHSLCSQGIRTSHYQRICTNDREIVNNFTEQSTFGGLKAPTLKNFTFLEENTIRMFRGAQSRGVQAVTDSGFLNILDLMIMLKPNISTVLSVRSPDIWAVRRMEKTSAVICKTPWLRVIRQIIMVSK